LQSKDDSNTDLKETIISRNSSMQAAIRRESFGRNRTYTAKPMKDYKFRI